jgi:predicted dehydrogenase
MRTRWGIMGTGFVARQFAASLRLLPDAELACVASRDPHNAARFAAGFGGRAVADLDALAASEVDVVYVATPTVRHAEDTIRLLEAGRAVLCEKPLATSAAEARRVIDTARHRRRFLMEALWTRFLPALVDLRARVRAGELGALRLVQADLSLPVAEDPRDPRFTPGPGAGCLLDLGVYPVSLALDLLGPPRAVRAHVLRTASGVDQQACLQLEYPEASAALSAGFLGRGRNDACVIGERARVQLAAPIYGPERSTTTGWPAPSPGDGGPRAMRRIDHVLERFGWLPPIYRPALPLLRAAAGRDRPRLAPFAGFGYQFEAAAVQERLRDGALEHPVMGWDDSLALQDVLDAARAS